MSVNNYLPALEQVYEFLRERPGFIGQSKFDNTIEYFRTLHEGNPKEFRFDAPHSVYGKFGSNPMINLKLVPDFNDKSNFIEWVYSQLNN